AHGVVEWAGEPVGETGPDSPECADDLLPCALPIAPEEREEGAQNAEDQIPGALNDGPHKLEAGVDDRSNLITEYRAEKGTDTIQRPADHRSHCVEPGLDEVRNRRQSDRRDLLDGVPCTSPIALERRGDGGPDGQDDVPPRLKHTNDGVPYRLHVVGDLVAKDRTDTVDENLADVVDDLEQRIENTLEERRYSVPDRNEGVLKPLPCRLPITLECGDKRIPEASECVEHPGKDLLHAFPECLHRLDDG